MNKLEDILEQFQNGERRYDEDPIFKSTVDSLKAGLGVYGVLDRVLKDYAALREASTKNLEELKALRANGPRAVEPDPVTAFVMRRIGLMKYLISDTVEMAKRAKYVPIPNESSMAESTIREELAVKQSKTPKWFEEANRIDLDAIKSIRPIDAERMIYGSFDYGSEPDNKLNTEWQGAKMGHAPEDDETCDL